MPVKTTCPGCHKTATASTKYAGLHAQCPGCGTKILFPSIQVESGDLPATAQASSEAYEFSQSASKDSNGDRSPRQSFDSTSHYGRFKSKVIIALIGTALAAVVWLSAVLNERESKISVHAPVQPPPVAANSKQGEPASEDPLQERDAAEKVRTLQPLSQIIDIETVESTSTIDQTAEVDDTQLGNGEKLLQEIIAEAEQSVVTIRVEGSGHRGTGSGFIVDASGTVVTNYHVIEGATNVIIAFPSGEEVNAEGWLAISVSTDLVLLASKPTPKGKPLALSISLPQKAETVYALGSSLGSFDGTVSSGIVSAIRKGSEVDSQLDPDAIIIQTTAPISLGNSGGPLLNGRGQVIAVITGFNAQGQNLNFAVSSRHVLELLREKPRFALRWEQLPRPREKKTPKEVVQEDWQLQKNEEIQQMRDQLAEEIKAAEKAKASSKAKQAKLNLIRNAASVLEQRINSIEIEGTSLTRQRGQIFSEAKGIMVEGRRLEDQYAALSLQIRTIRTDTDILIRRQDGSIDRIHIQQRQVGTLEAELAAMERDHARLTARIVTLDSKARDLRDQIKYKINQRDQLENERQLLVLKGRIVNEGAQVFINRMFEQWDRDKNGFLHPRESPDEYDVLMNYANRNGDRVVSRQELVTALEGLRD